MSSWIAPVVAALLATVAAIRLRATLRRVTYRREDEAGRAIPGFWWVLVVLPVAALFVTRALAEHHHVVVGVAYAAACVPLTALAAIDADVHRLPDRLTLPLAAAAVLIALLSSAVTGDWGALGRAVLVGALLFAIGFLVLFAAPGGGIGFGDVKLLVGLGVLTGWLGWLTVLSTMLVAFIAAGVWAALLLVTRRAHRHTAIAFGPFLIGGTVVALLGG